MQKSENKIKPMYFWSDGSDEYGILGPTPKKPIKDELEADVDNVENELEIENKGKFIKRSIKRRSLKAFLKKKVSLIMNGKYYR